MLNQQSYLSGNHRGVPIVPPEIGRSARGKLHALGSLAPISLLPLTAWVAAFAGLFTAGVLGVAQLLDLPVPYGGNRGCMAVIAHPSAIILGVPIAFYGVAAFVAILFLLARLDRVRWAGMACVLIAGVGTVASGTLLFYSQSVIRATCPWCIVSGAAMAVLLVLSVALREPRRAVPEVKSAWIRGFALLTVTGVAVQAAVMQKSAAEPPIPVERLAGLTSAELIDPAKSFGPPEAALTIVMFADLWCAECRQAHRSLLDYQRANPLAVRLAYRHLPLWELPGHEFSRTAAAFSEIAAEAGRFWTFVGLVHQEDTRINGAAYLRLMSSLGLSGADAQTRLVSPEDPAIERVEQDMKLAERFGIQATPTFILLLDGAPAVSANSRTLRRALNSPEVLSRLAGQAQPHVAYPVKGR